MSEVLEAPPRPAFANFVGGEWRPSSSGKTYEKRGPWRPSEAIGEFPASGAEDVDAAVEAAAAAFPEWSRRPAAQARGDPDGRRRRDRAAGRADRAGHDARDGQAAARGADGGGPRRSDPPLLRRRGLAAEGRAVRAVGDRQLGLHGPARARRRRPDHAVELPGGDPGLEDRARSGLRQHGRDEARAGGAADRPAPGRLLRGGGDSGRRLQHRRRPRLGGRHAARQPPEGARRSRSRARSRSATGFGTRRLRSASASSSSSAATTR